MLYCTIIHLATIGIGCSRNACSTMICPQAFYTSHKQARVFRLLVRHVVLIQSVIRMYIERIRYRRLRRMSMKIKLACVKRLVDNDKKGSAPVILRRFTENKSRSPAAYEPTESELQIFYPLTPSEPKRFRLTKSLCDVEL